MKYRTRSTGIKEESTKKRLDSDITSLLTPQNGGNLDTQALRASDLVDNRQTYSRWFLCLVIVAATAYGMRTS